MFTSCLDKVFGQKNVDVIAHKGRIGVHLSKKGEFICRAAGLFKKFAAGSLLRRFSVVDDAARKLCAQCLFAVAPLFYHEKVSVVFRNYNYPVAAVDYDVFVFLSV